ncbi:MAG: hypothetical protein E7616_01320 [Ruminococcaceae bacterium]|nr:hypothetical protein [Oscillospiraceae bacterium]
MAVKKKILTFEMIQQDFIHETQKRRALSVWLTALLLLGMIGYIVLCVTGLVLQNDSLSISVVFLMPLLLLLIIVFLLKFYYIDFYKIKNGQFSIVTEELYEKKKEQTLYYRELKIENFLYFRCGRVAVSDDIYVCSNRKDRFYVVIVGTNKRPVLAYNMKYYKVHTA